MEEEIIYPSDEELESSFVDDLFSAFMKEVKKYPLLSIEEQKELAFQYRAGDLSAREKLINHNLRLVVHIASSYKHRIKHMQIMDIINEGIIGLMTAVDKYDPTIGALSTYATGWIRQAIGRAINITEEDIRKPDHIIYKIHKYRNIYNRCKEEKRPLPSDDELLIILDCTPEILEVIKKKAFEKVVSANTKINDEDDSELLDFIPVQKNDYDVALNKINDHELLTVLKNKLSPIGYYILYNYEISNKSDDTSLEDLGKQFKLTRERIRQIKNKALDEAKPYIINKKIRRLAINTIEETTGYSISNFRSEPIDPKDIIMFSYVQKNIDDQEKKLLFNLLFSEINMPLEELFKYIKISKSQYNNLQDKIKNALKDSSQFEDYKDMMIRTYGTKIFMLLDEYNKKYKLEINNKKSDIQRDQTTNAEPVKPPSEINVFKILNSNNHDELVILKEKLSPIEYYLYYSLITGEGNSETIIRNIASNLSISYEQLIFCKNRIEKKLKKFFSKPNFFKDEKKKVETEYRTSINNMIVNPVDPEKIILKNYVAGYLTEEENELLCDLIERKTLNVSNNLLSKMHITHEEYTILINRLHEKIAEILSNQDAFINYRKKFIHTFGEKIFNKTFNHSFQQIDYNLLKQKYDSLSYEEIKELYGDAWNVLDDNSKNLLKRYFSVPENPFCSRDTWENSFYLEYYNIEENISNSHLSPRILYDTYLRNKELFSKSVQKFLECFVFKTKAESEYYEEYPEKRIYSNSYYIYLDKLEKLYYNVYNIFRKYDFNREQWLDVLKKHEDKFSENKIAAMNMFYGVGISPMSISDIAEVFGVESETMHDYIAKVRLTAISLYTGRSILRDINEEKYIPYVLSNAYAFQDITRDILKMYLIEELSYAEIKSVLEERGIKKSQYQISNIVTDGLRRIDFYRFGLTPKDIYSQNFIKSFIRAHKEFTLVDKKIIKAKYIEHLDNDTIAKNLGKEKVNINKQVQRFNTLIDRYRTMNVELTEEDYLQEFNEPILERVVNEEQIEMLSYFFGIKCKYNLSGERYTVKNMIKKIPKYNKEYESNLGKKIKYANTLIKLKSLNLYHNDFVYISTAKMEKFMDDPHLPISDKERFIICSFYGIKNHESMNFSQLASHFDELESSIYTRYRRAIVSIFKYECGEIPPKINYEVDIIPILRYFPKSDRLLIEDYYKEGLSYDKVSKKYKITFDKIVARYRYLHYQIFEMLKNPQRKKFDFDFFEEAIKDPLLPYYGNLEEAVELFNDYFSNSTSDSKNKRSTKDNQIVSNLIMSVCQYRDGKRKAYTYTYDDVVDYYNRHQDEMATAKKIIYLSYFKRILSSSPDRNKGFINKRILTDLLIERNPELPSIDYSSHDQVVALLKDPNRHFSRKVTDSLLNMIGETERITMSGQEQNHVYRMLNRLDKNLMIIKEPSLLLK